MKAVVAAFNQEKALVGAFSVIVQPVVEPMDRFAALLFTQHTQRWKGCKQSDNHSGYIWNLTWDGQSREHNISNLIQFAATIPIIAAQSQNLISTPFRCLLDVFSMIYVDRCTSVSAASVEEFHKVGNFKFQFNHNFLFIGFPLNYKRPVVSTCCFCFSWYFENHHVMLWSHWLYIFDTVAPLVYFFTPFIHSILIVKMYKRHIFTLLNEVSPCKSIKVNPQTKVVLSIYFLHICKYNIHIHH